MVTGAPKVGALFFFFGAVPSVVNDWKKYYRQPQQLLTIGKLKKLNAKNIIVNN